MSVQESIARRGPVATRRGMLAGGSAVAGLFLAGCGQGGESQSGGGGVRKLPLQAFTAGQVDQLLQSLAQAPTHGFAPAAFPADQIRSRLQSDRKAGERALQTATIAYARALKGLAIPKAQLDPNWGMRARPYDAETEFAAAVGQNRIEDWLASLPPPFPAYEALRRGYAAYLKVLPTGGWQPIPEGSPIRPGASDPRIQAMRTRLALEDAEIAQADRALPYDQGLAQAVRRFQARNGLQPTGVADVKTLHALNVSPSDRAGQIRANLERWRWVPRTLAPDRVEVNSVAGTFDLYLGNQPALHMLAAAGRPGDETPILTSTIDQLVLNPTWNVPDSIAEKELFPKEAAHPGYFAREHFVVDPPGKGVRLMQQPGPKNALGQVKFQFANSYGVYLHDTPARAAFDLAQRSVSHGCVRLERAIDFAHVLLNREQDWPPEKVDEVLAGDETTTVKLSHPVQVSLFYWTAFPEADQVSFREDIYGWDTEVVRLLDANLSG